MSINVYPAAPDTAAANPLTAFGDLRTAELSPVFQGSFEYTVDNTELTVNTKINGGSVTQANAMAVIGTSTTTASWGRLHSRRHAKYRAGLGGLFRFTALYTAPVANTIQYMGLADAHGSSAEFINGLTVGCTGDVFGFQRWQNDVLFETLLTDWDDPLDGTGASGMTLDPTKLNVFGLRFQYLGGGPTEVWFEGTTQELTLVHTDPYAGLNTVPSTYSPNYIMMMHADNLGTTSNIVLKSASYGYFVEGKTQFTEIQQPIFSSEEQTTSSVTTELAIFTIRNKATYASKTNYIDVVLEAISASIEASNANNLGNIRVVKNATLGGTPSFADINTTDSVVDIDTAGTTLTGGRELFSFSLAGKNDKLFHGVGGHKIFISPGETVTVSGTSAASATINSSILWKELF